MKAVIIGIQQGEEELMKIKTDFPDYNILSSGLAKIIDKDVEKLPPLGENIKATISKDVMEYILDFGDKFIKGKRIHDILKIKGISFWYYHKFRIYFELRNFLYELEVLKQASDLYEELIYFTSNNKFEIFQSELPNVEFRIVKQKAKINWNSVFNYTLFFGLRSIIGLLQLPMCRRQSLCVLDRSKKQFCLNRESLVPERENYSLVYLFDRLDDNAVRIYEEEPPKFNTDSSYKFSWKSFDFRKTKYKKLYGEVLLLKQLISSFRSNDKHEFQKTYNDAFETIWKGLTDPQDLLTASYLKDFSKVSFFYLQKNNAYHSFFKNSSIKSVATIDENSPSVKAIEDAAKKLGKKVVGIQHGAIHILHPAYRYTKNDPFDNVLPDITLTWGQYWTDFLIKHGNYPQNKVVTVGQIRTDIIPRLLDSEVVSQSKMSEKFRVMFASQPQRDPLLRYQAAFDVFKAASQLNDVSLELKLHPSEMNDVDYYKQIARDAGCENYEIVYDRDLYQMIAQSSLVITCFSTVGTEVVYFKKPLVVLDPLNLDIQGYIKNKVAFKATNADELKSLISKIQIRELSPDEKAQDDFIHLYAHEIDGNTGARVLDHINVHS